MKLKYLLETTQEIVRDAARILLREHRKPRQIEHKGRVDLVTQADRLIEDLIVSDLQAHFPEHTIVGEEGEDVGDIEGLRWYIDPIDGTTNFAHSFPVFAISIGLVDDEGPLIGVIMDPLRDELFAAARGHGATLNDEPIRVSAVDELIDSLLATGFPYDRHTAEDNNLEAFGVFLRKAQGMRRAGAAALDLAYVACGRVDAYWEQGVRPWDIAAGLLLVEEADGQVTTYSGEAATVDSSRIVASNGVLHPAMVDTLGLVYG